MSKSEWDRKTRSGKLAAILYPQLESDLLRREMAQLSANEQKRPPASTPLLSNSTRGAVSPLNGMAK